MFVDCLLLFTPCLENHGYMGYNTSNTSKVIQYIKWIYTN